MTRPVVTMYKGNDLYLKSGEPIGLVQGNSPVTIAYCNTNYYASMTNLESYIRDGAIPEMPDVFKLMPPDPEHSNYTLVQRLTPQALSGGLAQALINKVDSSSLDH